MPVKILTSILCLQILIVFHELGHFLFAKLYGMRASKFSVGFGPKLLSLRRGETTYQLALIPLGGFVQIEGMNPDESLNPKDPSLYTNKPMWQRLVVVLMGPIMNFLLAILFFTCILRIGLEKPDLSQPKIGQIVPQSPADQAGLAKGDIIVSINGQKLSNFEDLVRAINLAPHDTVLALVAQRGPQTIERALTPVVTQGNQVIGIQAPITTQQSANLFAAVRDAVVLTGIKSAEILQSLASLVTGSSSGKLMGLPGIIKTLTVQSERGVVALLGVLALLSINLGVFNLLPIPSLDGSRMVFLAIEGVRKKPVNIRIETIVHTVGFALLFGLLILISVRDLIHPHG